jgi:hypothetical protein
MNKSDTLKELATSLAKAQCELENATKATTNAFFKSKYADLAECLNTVRPVFSKHGLSISQFPTYENGIAHVETILLHSSGEWLSNVSSAPVGKQDAQGVGSATTYLRRYALAAIAGIAQEDDDANNSVGKTQADIKPIAPLNAKVAEYINTKQLNTISELIHLTSTDLSKFLNFYKVESLDKIHSHQYEAVEKALSLKLDQINAKKEV